MCVYIYIYNDNNNDNNNDNINDNNIYNNNCNNDCKNNNDMIVIKRICVYIYIYI